MSTGAPAQSDPRRWIRGLAGTPRSPSEDGQNRPTSVRGQNPLASPASSVRVQSRGRDVVCHSGSRSASNSWLRRSHTVAVRRQPFRWSCPRPVLRRIPALPRMPVFMNQRGSCSWASTSLDGLCAKSLGFSERARRHGPRTELSRATSDAVISLSSACRRGGLAQAWLSAPRSALLLWLARTLCATCRRGKHEHFR